MSLERLARRTVALLYLLAAVLSPCSSWADEQAKLTASDSDGTERDNFGRAVSVSGDTAVIGAWQDDDDDGFDSGSAYVFERSGTVWTQQERHLLRPRREGLST